MFINYCSAVSLNPSAGVVQHQENRRGCRCNSSSCSPLVACSRYPSQHQQHHPPYTSAAAALVSSLDPATPLPLASSFHAPLSAKPSHLATSCLPPSSTHHPLYCTLATTTIQAKAQRSYAHSFASPGRRHEVVIPSLSRRGRSCSVRAPVRARGRRS